MENASCLCDSHIYLFIYLFIFYWSKTGQQSFLRAWSQIRLGQPPQGTGQSRRANPLRQSVLNVHVYHTSPEPSPPPHTSAQSCQPRPNHCHKSAEIHSHLIHRKSISGLCIDLKCRRCVDDSVVQSSRLSGSLCPLCCVEVPLYLITLRLLRRAKTCSTPPFCFLLLFDSLSEQSPEHHVHKHIHIHALCHVHTHTHTHKHTHTLTSC